MAILDDTCSWRPCPIFPNEYLVSDDGRIFSTRTKRELKSNTDQYGYRYYTLCVDSDRRTVKAHRMVAMAFIDNPDNKPTVNHKNGIKNDNRICNLEWATHKEQTNDPLTAKHLAAVHQRTDYKAMGAKRNYGRIAVVVSKGFECRIYPSLMMAAKALGISYSKASEILSGKMPQRKAFTIGRVVDQ